MAKAKTPKTKTTRPTRARAPKPVDPTPSAPRLILMDVNERVVIARLETPRPATVVNGQTRSLNRLDHEGQAYVLARKDGDDWVYRQVVR